jgi:hypothetical protein
MLSPTRADPPFAASRRLGCHIHLAQLAPPVIEGRGLTMSIRVLGVLAMSLGLVAFVAPPASAQLTLAQVTAITRCQDALNREGRALVAKAQSGLEGCAAAKLTPELKDDNGLITPERFDIDNDRATTTCNRLLTGVSTQTTRMINNVIRACGPVEALILAPDPPPDGDPLLLVEVWGATTVEELAGLVCGESLAEAAFMAVGKIPRGLDILSTDPDVNPSDVDPRCVF